MKKGNTLENVFVEKLIFGGKGLAISEDGKKIIITGGVIPQSVVNLRVLKSKKNYIEAQLLETIKKSPLEQELPEHFQVYGGCKWLPIKYEKQLEIKEEQVKEAFNPIKNLVTNATFHTIVPSPEIYGYRNKVEFSWGKYISAKEGVYDVFRFGFHKQGEFDRIVECDYCVLADEEINKIYREVDIFARESGLPTYDPKTNEGFWRHFVVRKAHYTNETMLIFSLNTSFPDYGRKHEGEMLVFANLLAEKYPNIVSIYMFANTGKADIVQGEATCMFGKKTITENLLGYSFEINPKSFFQTNSLGAEKLYSTVLDLIDGKGGIALDLYAGTGTIGILLASKFDKVYSVELVKEASQDGKKNAKLNNVSNIEFINQKAEDFLQEFTLGDTKAKLLVIDPPRDGMHPDALKNILKFDAEEMVYVSCNPATLARDLAFMLENGAYEVTDVVPVDMFPHTHHIETVVKLKKRSA